MKTIILAGGFGTRLSEYTGTIPKPMVPIGGKPILWHIMNNYAHFNHKDFYLALGYKSEIIKDYFSEKYNTDADFLILRHTLEHIKDPFTFLHLIAKANNYLGKIYIEVPTFDWISDRTAFWDITYEHCKI